MSATKVLKAISDFGFSGHEIDKNGYEVTATIEAKKEGMTTKIYELCRQLHDNGFKAWHYGPRLDDRSGGFERYTFWLIAVPLEGERIKEYDEKKLRPKKLPKCKYCKEVAIWAWQPDLDESMFWALGWHPRGFRVIKVCDSCKENMATKKEVTL